MKTNKFNPIKCILCLMLCLTMVVGLTPMSDMGAAYAATSGSGTVQYLELKEVSEGVYNLEASSCNAYYLVRNDEPVLGMSGQTTWYVLTQNQTFDKPVEILGDVHLILKDDCTLNAPQGIICNENNSLTIYSQSNQNKGRIVATGTSGNAGIGSASGSNVNGKITINGGTIYAQGGEYAAGIGGGYCSAGKNIMVNYGAITAHGGNGGAGIGGGYHGEGAYITVNNGEITEALGGTVNGGAGIGGGYNANGSNITINGGKVKGKGYDGAGIGGGCCGNGTDITIAGGEVDANSQYGACIGGGKLDTSVSNPAGKGIGTGIHINSGITKVSLFTWDGGSLLGNGRNAIASSSDIVVAAELMMTAGDAYTTQAEICASRTNGEDIANDSSFNQRTALIYPVECLVKVNGSDVKRYESFASVTNASATNSDDTLEITLFKDVKASATYTSAYNNGANNDYYGIFKGYREVTLNLNGHVLDLNGRCIKAEGSNQSLIVNGGATSTSHYFLKDSDGFYATHTDSSKANAANAASVNGGVIFGGRGIYGGAIKGTATITNTTLCGNASVKHSSEGSLGGAVYTNQTVYLNGANLIGNKAQNGGAIYNNGGTVYLNEVNLTGNKAEKGGAVHNIYNNSNGGTFVATGCSIEDCVATGTTVSRGGAVYNEGTASVSYLYNTIVKGCDAYEAAICNDLGRVELYNSTITDCEGVEAAAISNRCQNSNAGTIIASGCNISDNITKLSTSSYSGTIENYSYGIMQLYNSSICSNISNANGGAINNNGKLTVNSCSITGNKAIGSASSNGRGGGICNYGKATISDTIISSNTCYSDGGGIYSSGTLVCDNCTITGNFATNSDVKYGNGGGIYSCDNGTTKLTNTVICSNTSNSAGGGIYNTKSLTITGCTITGNVVNSQNSTYGQGGGIYNISSAAAITDTVISKNQSRNGGGIYSKAEITLKDVTITENQAASAGGGLTSYSENTDTKYITISGKTNITGNYAPDGTISNLYLNAGNSCSIYHVKLEEPSIGTCIGVRFNNAAANCIIVDSNAAESDASYFTSDDETYTVVYGSNQIKLEARGSAVCKVNGTSYTDFDTAVQNAGADGKIELLTDVEATGDLVISNTNVTIALNGRRLDLKGHHIIVKSTGSLTIDGGYQQLAHYFEIDESGCWATATNTSSDKTTSIIGAVITNGYATNGGAVEIESGGSATVTNVTLIGNQAQLGGAVYSKGNLSISDAKIKFNISTAAGSDMGGGGIYAIGQELGSLPVALSNVEITNNYSGSPGGGIAIRWTKADMSNVKVSDNTSNYDAGGIYNCDSKTIIIDGNLTDNEVENAKDLAAAGMVNCQHAIATLTNTTVSSNTSSKASETDIGGIRNDDSSTLVLDGSTVKDNVGKIAGGVYNQYVLIARTSAAVTGNKTTAGVANNIYLPSGKTITCDDANSSMDIGITTEATPAGSNIKIADIAGSKVAEHIHSDKPEYAVTYNSNNMTAELTAGSNLTISTEEKWFTSSTVTLEGTVAADYPNVTVDGNTATVTSGKWSYTLKNISDTTGTNIPIKATNTSSEITLSYNLKVDASKPQIDTAEIRDASNTTLINLKTNNYKYSKTGTIYVEFADVTSGIKEVKVTKAGNTFASGNYTLVMNSDSKSGSLTIPSAYVGSNVTFVITITDNAGNSLAQSIVLGDSSSSSSGSTGGTTTGGGAAVVVPVTPTPIQEATKTSTKTDTTVVDNHTIKGGSGEIKVNVEVKGTAAVLSEISAEDVKKLGTSDNISIDLTQIAKDATSIEISKFTADNIAYSGAPGLQITYGNGVVVRFGKNALKAVTEQAAGDEIKIVATARSDAENLLTTSQKSVLKTMGTHVVLDAKIYSNGQLITDFKGGTVTLKYKYDADKYVRTWYLAENGTKERISRTYDGTTVSMGVQHFSTYVIEEFDGNNIIIRNVIGDMTLRAKTSYQWKNGKRYIKVTAVAEGNTGIEDLHDMGYDFEYTFYRGTTKYAYDMSEKVTKYSNTYLNTSGTKNKKYYYRVTLNIYDPYGRNVGGVNYTMCKYGTRKYNTNPK